MSPWKPDKVVCLKIEASDGVDLSPRNIEEKIGWVFDTIRVIDMDSGVVSEESVIKKTTCDDCGSMEGQQRQAWRYGDGIGAATPPYCQDCWLKRREYYQPLPGLCLLKREAREMSGWGKPCGAARSIKEGETVATCDECSWWRGKGGDLK